MQRGCELRTGIKEYLQTPGSVRKAVRDNVLNCGTAPVCSLALETSRIFSGPLRGHQNVDLKQIDFQLFIQQ